MESKNVVVISERKRVSTGNQIAGRNECDGGTVVVNARIVVIVRYGRDRRGSRTDRQAARVRIRHPEERSTIETGYRKFITGR